MRNKILIFTALLFICTTNASAQKFLWNVDFDFQFDNREYSGTLVRPTTLFGCRVAPEVGIGWDNPRKGMNGLMAGLDLTVDFGAKLTPPELLLYYTYQSPRFKAYAGLFPRSKMIGDYSNAFFSDSVRFYDSVLSGLLLNYTDPWGSVEIGCDWNSMYSRENREKFMLFSAGRFHYKWFLMGYALQMYHFANSYVEKGVVDNILVSPYVGFDLNSIVPLDTLHVKLAYNQAYQWVRSSGNRPTYPKGGQIDIGIEKWGVGIHNAFYFGENLMPYFEQYGHALYWGEDYYRTPNKIYNRLEVYWHPIKSADLDVKIKSVHHFEGKHWAWQQVVALGVTINEGMFGSFKKSPKWWKKKKSATDEQ